MPSIFIDEILIFIASICTKCTIHHTLSWD